MKRLLLIILLLNMALAAVEVNIKTRFKNYTNIVLNDFNDDKFFIVNDSKNLFSRKSIKCYQMLEITDKWGNTLSCDDLKILVNNNKSNILKPKETIQKDLNSIQTYRNKSFETKNKEEIKLKSIRERQRLGGLFIALGGAILLTNSSECKDCETPTNNNTFDLSEYLKNSNKALEKAEFRAKLGTAFIMFGGFLLFL